MPKIRETEKGSGYFWGRVGVEVVFKKGLVRDFWSNGSFLFLDRVVFVRGVHGHL